MNKKWRCLRCGVPFTWYSGEPYICIATDGCFGRDFAPVFPPSKEPLPMIRQGDVLLIKVAQIPANARPVKRDNGRLILALGEATGHAHVLDAPPEEAVLLTDKENRRFLNLISDARLVHEEHTPLHVPAGMYRQIPQREWADSMNQKEPERGEVRPVFD